MASEPVTIYSRHIRPVEVLDAVRQRYPAVTADGDGADWRRLTVPFPVGNLVLTHDPDYYAGPDWPRQRQGMANYLSRFPATDETRRRLAATVDDLAFALAVWFEPDYEDPSEDDRFAVVCGVTSVLDGVLFSPSALRDAAGRVLVAADGEYDPESVWPSDYQADEDEEDEPTPPTAERVTRRALVLTAVVARATLTVGLTQGEIDAAEAGRRHALLIGWFDQLAIDAEAEPDERSWIDSLPAGEVTQDAINGLWRVEGLAVLAWALGRYDLPRYDETVLVEDVLGAMGFLDPAAAETIATASLREADELGVFGSQMLGYHWRMRDYGLRPMRMNFRDFAGNCWFGSFDLSPFDLIDDELALDGERLDRCDRETFSRCTSIVMERHKASNWLRWGGELYSEVDTST